MNAEIILHDALARELNCNTIPCLDLWLPPDEAIDSKSVAKRNDDDALPNSLGVGTQRRGKERAW